MKKQKNVDPIQELNEWQEHMYNPGYWINRFSPFFPPKRGRLTAYTSLINLVVMLPMFVVVSYFAITMRNLGGFFLALILGAMTLSSLVMLVRFWPRRDSNSQPETRKKKRRK